MNYPSDADVLSVLAETSDAVDDADSSTRIITSDTVISVKGGEFQKMELREPPVYAVLEASKKIGPRPDRESVYESQIDLVARVCGWKLAALYELSTRKLDEAIVFVTDFEENARRAPDEKPNLAAELLLVAPKEIEAVNRVWREMNLREPNVGERRSFKASESKGTAFAYMQGEMRLLASVSGWPDAAILKMPISMFARGADYCTGFFIPGLQTGKSSEPT